MSALMAKTGTPGRLPDLMIPNLGSLQFDLPPELEAGEPPEARGLARDQVRLMVSYRALPSRTVMVP